MTAIKPGDLVKLKDDRWSVIIVQYLPTKSHVELVADFIILADQGNREHFVLELKIDDPPMLYLGSFEINMADHNNEFSVDYQLEVLRTKRVHPKYWLHKFLHEGKIWYLLESASTAGIHEYLTIFLPTNS